MFLTSNNIRTSIRAEIARLEARVARLEAQMERLEERIIYLQLAARLSFALLFLALVFLAYKTLDEWCIGGNCSGCLAESWDDGGAEVGLLTVDVEWQQGIVVLSSVAGWRCCNVKSNRSCFHGVIVITESV
ncbi:hypothetical protein Ancab_038584 [Ancistrocladus abbreviatus]